MRPKEPTHLECLSDASFLGKLLVLPANVRLDWKEIRARYKHSSLFGLIISNEGKKFYNINTWCQCYKTFSFIVTEAFEPAMPSQPGLKLIKLFCVNLLTLFSKLDLYYSMWQILRTFIKGPNLQKIVSKFKAK
jgi:hypothetical protein